jgi:hypothetical protein
VQDPPLWSTNLAVGLIACLRPNRAICAAWIDLPNAHSVAE